MSNVLLERMKKYARESGHACDIEYCTNISIGFVCDYCNRRLCNSHLYFKAGSPSQPLTPVCPYCIVVAHSDLFEVE